MSKTTKRIVHNSATVLVMMGFLGIASLASADEVATTVQETQVLQTDREAISTALLAEVRADLDTRLPAEIALLIESQEQADTLQADVK